MTPIIELQTAIYQKLTGLGLQVFDYRPDQEPFPYVMIGEDEFILETTKTNPAYHVVSVINVLSNKKGNMEVKTIMNTIISNLNSFEMDGWSLMYTELIATSIDTYTNPDVIHGVITFGFRVIKI